LLKLAVKFLTGIRPEDGAGVVVEDNACGALLNDPTPRSGY
jgi:hypothetical protein